MSDLKTNDWDPGTYAKFRGLRLRPAMDLLAQVPEIPAGDVVDLGCGNGAVGAALALLFAGRNLIGVDTSPAMLEAAKKTGAYTSLTQADALEWQPETPPALIFSNALCHWLPDHQALFARLCGFLAEGGALAVQMPRQYGAPSHALLRDLATSMFPDRFDFTGWQAPVAPPEAYAKMLHGLGTANIWETQYIQPLAPVATGHPVRHFTQSTAMRPFVEKLTPDEAAYFQAAYDTGLLNAYPLDNSGGASFAFRRVFFTLTRGS